MLTRSILPRSLDKDYLAKSAGFDIHRPFDRERELMEDAERDADIARAITNGTAMLDEDGRPMVGRLAIESGDPGADGGMNGTAENGRDLEENEKEDGDDGDGDDGEGDAGAENSKDDD